MPNTALGYKRPGVIVRIEKPGYIGPDADQRAAAAADGAADEDSSGNDEQAPSGDADGPGPLPLSA
jgi:single-strand DNA-binding protein